ncbi:uncharacterized protein TNCV_2591431 [Trichonephila clavipes]|nr:uncharacterized protein TNCV_2591431 [Trichonephila clavipes]
MYASSSSVNSTHLAHADKQGDGPQRGVTSSANEKKVRSASGFNVLPEVYFSGSWNVTEFLEIIDKQIRFLDIPSDLSCPYLKGHLLGRAQNWYQIFGSVLVQNTATDSSQLKAALSKAFPAIHNRKYLEIMFYAPQQRRDQEPTDFVYDLLKTLKLGMSEETLVDHIFVRLEPQVQDYEEVQNPQTMGALSKFEERYPCKAMRGSRHSDNVERQGWNERRISNADDNRRNWRNSEVVRRSSNVRNDIGITTRMAFKEISGSTAGINFRRMIEDLTIGDTILEMGLKKTILAEGTAE